MKHLAATLSLCVLAGSLTACGSDKTTVIHEPVPVTQSAPAPVVIHDSSATPGTVESTCSHGYDNRTHSCY